MLSKFEKVDCGLLRRINQLIFLHVHQNNISTHALEVEGISAPILSGSYPNQAEDSMQTTKEGRKGDSFPLDIV
jgi:hypothetical protein